MSANRAIKYQQGKQGVPAFTVWLEQGGGNHVSQVNKRAIEKRKGRGVRLLARLLLCLLTRASFHDTAEL